MTDSTKRPPKVAYRPFTTRFDVEIGWAGLARVLDGYQSSARAVDDAWKVLDTNLLPWRTALTIFASQAGKRVRNSVSPEVLRNTVVSLLLDQSGSMRGQKMLFAAASLDVAQEFLSGLGVKVEVLGFTTVRWRGGRSRWLWRLAGARRMPGRLNDRLHVVYREADDSRVSGGYYAYRQMLQPNLPKENIDGEALEWASERLRRRSEGRKILLVLSDGAPVDDSTLLSNHGHYLEDHLLDVIASLESSKDIELAAMGIGFSVGGYYSRSEAVEDPIDLGEALLSQLANILIEGSVGGDAGRADPGGAPPLMS